MAIFFVLDSREGPKSMVTGCKGLLFIWQPHRLAAGAALGYYRPLGEPLPGECRKPNGIMYDLGRWP